jgi:hypothetical protein
MREGSSGDRELVVVRNSYHSFDGKAWSIFADDAERLVVVPALASEDD